MDIKEAVRCWWVWAIECLRTPEEAGATVLRRHIKEKATQSYELAVQRKQRDLTQRL